MTKLTLLIVSDDGGVVAQMRRAFSQGYEVNAVRTQAEALAAFVSVRPVATVLDLGLPPWSHGADEGKAALAGLLTADPLAKIIVISDQASRTKGFKAVGSGAYDCLSKPLDIEQLRIVLERCVYVARLEREFHALQSDKRGDVFEGMLGSSPQMQTVFSFVHKVAPTSAPVLILGESGTGKQMVAQAIHRRSLQKDGPFVAINCSAIPESLLESELFGHDEKGVTGTSSRPKGPIEKAEGGTLFLDEIGGLPPSVQAKLLRFLQQKRFHRGGKRQETLMPARVVASTHASLEESVADGSFRHDLYFRLAVVVVALPPLRERGDDIVRVARALLHRYATQHGRPNLSFSTDALQTLTLYRWPGNVRELENRVQRAVIMADGKFVTARDLELNAALGTLPTQTLREARENLERELVQSALRRHHGKVTAAALDLGVSRPKLYELMEKLRIPRNPLV